MFHIRNRRIALCVTLTLLISLFSNVIVFAESGYGRFDGKNRYETSGSIAKYLKKLIPERKNNRFDSVVVAYGLDFPDALSGSVLASKVNAPIILVGNSVDESFESIVSIRNNTNNDATIYLLGGENAVKNEIVEKLKERDLSNFKRLGGSDRYETNMLINNELDIAKGTPVIIASGVNFPDALSISGVAGTKQMPIYLVGNNIKPEILNKIKEIEPSTIYIAGGTAAVNSDIENTLKTVTNNIVRFDGKDRYETSLKIADYFSESPYTALVANGLKFPDALSGSVLAAKTNAPIILVPSKGNVSKQKTFLDKFNIKGINVAGGTTAVSEQVVKDLIGTNNNPTDQKGMLPTEIGDKLEEIGMVFEPENSGYGILVYRSVDRGMSVAFRDNDDRLEIGLYQRSEANYTILKSIIDMAFPTAADEVYNLAVNPSPDHNINRDGKNVEFRFDPLYINTTISIYYENY